MPNLFTYATKELSQDAMICWLIEWSAVQVANESQQALRDLGRAFVQALLGKHRVNLAGAIRHAEIHQQDRSIDVLARIQDEHAGHVFLIEDKTGTKDTSDKLQRYQDAVSSGKTKLGEVPEHWPIYLKTGNQSHAEDRKVEDIGYKVFRREDFLTVLDGYRGTHPVAMDFREHLQRLEDGFNSFSNWRQGQGRQTWSWSGWEGFYRRLERELEADDRHDMDWGYIPNQTGGFLGFYWFPFNGGNNTRFYLQLEIAPGNLDRQKLCFKVQTGEHKGARYYYQLLRTAAGELGEDLLVRPDHFGHGKTMTVGWWRGEWLAFDADGWLDFSGIAENLRQASRIVRAAQRLLEHGNN